MKKIFYLTNIFPIYRESIWNLLRDDKSYDFHFFFSNQDLSGIKSISSDQHSKYHEVKNHFFMGRLIWQSKFLKKFIINKPDILILLGEMNIISNWILVVIARIFNIRVYYWGHGVYGNENYIKNYFRILHLKLANGLILYGNWSKAKLMRIGFDKKKLHVVYNSINYDQQLDLFQKLKKEKKNSLFKNNYPVLLFVGRLTKQKKIDQLIEVVKKLNKKSNFNLLVIGDGEEKLYLESLAQDLIKENKCIFYGKSYEEKELSKLIYDSDLTVSPGNVGLTAIHSLSYGVPVCTHDNFNFQMPEVEAIKEFENGIFFNENDLGDLTSKIMLWFSKYDGKLTKSEIRKVVDEYYNPLYQIEVLKKILV